MSWSPPILRQSTESTWNASEGARGFGNPARWYSDTSLPSCAADIVTHAAQKTRVPVHIVLNEDGEPAIGMGGRVLAADETNNGHSGYPLLALIPPLPPEHLGDTTFLQHHRVRYCYAAGAMANGIASPRLVAAMAEDNMLAFLGTAGLGFSGTDKAIDRLLEELAGQDRPWGADLIHTPGEPELEAALVDLYLKRGVTCASASAFMRLTPSVVRYACTGLRRDESGEIHRKNRLFAKLSRPEVATFFLSPAPQNLLSGLVSAGLLRAEEAELAAHVPLAEDITVESDSAGHTDNRPLGVLLPVIADLRDRLTEKFRYGRRIRVGAAGGLGTPDAVAAAFALGADFVLTGSVNQCAVEAAQSATAKKMLAAASFTDVIMAPSPDMFELGVKVQVLKRGTLYAARAARLYELYRAHDCLEQIPAEVRTRLEQEVFQSPLDRVWEETRQFFAQRNPRELERAQCEHKHRMALVFRWYLGQSSRWAIAGTPGRELDYQVWCGPATGACNGWLTGSFMEDPAQRSVVQLARNLMEGAAVASRAQQLRSFGLPVPPAAFRFRPRHID